MNPQLLTSWLLRLFRKRHNSRISTPHPALSVEPLETRTVPAVFSGPIPLSTNAVGFAAVGDFDGNGTQDLLTSSVGSSNGPLNLYLSNTNGTLQPPRSISGIQNPQGIAVGDFTGNHNLDFAVASAAGFGIMSSVTVELGNGDGIFQPPVSYPTSTGTSQLVVAGDFTNDNKLDLAVINSDGTLSILLGNGDGTFQAAHNITGGPIGQGGDVLTGMVVGYFDSKNNNNLDLIVTGTTGGVIYLGNGDGTFTVTPDSALYGDSTVTGDFNGDHQADVALSSRNEGQVRILLGNGAGTIGPATSFPTGTPDPWLAAADFTGDGNLDLAVNGALLTGTGNGAFNAPQYFPSLPVEGFLLAGDLNGDAKPDLISDAGYWVNIETQPPAVSANTLYVSGLKHDLLQTPASTQDLSTYTSSLNASSVQARSQTVAEILGSPEYRSLLLNDSLAGIYFPSLVGWSPTSAEFQAALAQLEQGQTDEQVVAGILSGSAYFQFCGNDNLTWVVDLYSSVLNYPTANPQSRPAVEPTTVPAGADYWVNLLNAGVSRYSVALGFLTSAECRNQVVSRLYETFLNRSGSAAELQYWVNQLAQQTDEQVIAAIAGSAENWQLHDSNITEWLTSGFLSLLNRLPAASDLTYFQNQVIAFTAPARQQVAAAVIAQRTYQTNQLDGYFQKYLGRAPTTAEVQYYLNLFDLVGKSAEQVQALILSSPAYFSLSTINPTTWLNDVYEEVLGRPVDSASVAYWSSQGQAAAWFYDVALGILESTEAHTGQIQADYQAVLHRAAGSADVTYWLSQFQVGFNEAEVLAAILASEEYFLLPHQYP